MSSLIVAVWRSFVAPTVITLRELQGLVMVTCPSRPRLPAEQTTTMPASQSASTACTSGSTAGRLVDRVAEGEVDDADAVLVLVVERSTAARPARPRSGPRPMPSRTRTETRLASGATPARRPPELAAVADHDARHVGAVAVGVDARPRAARPARSGWPTTSTTAVRVWMSGCRATPESTTAIVTPAPLSALSGSCAAGLVGRLARDVHGRHRPARRCRRSSTASLSARAATRCAGRRRDIQRDDGLQLAALLPAEPVTSACSAAPGAWRKRTSTSSWRSLCPVPPHAARALATACPWRRSRRCADAAAPEKGSGDAPRSPHDASGRFEMYRSLPFHFLAGR